MSKSKQKNYDFLWKASIRRRQVTYFNHTSPVLIDYLLVSYYLFYFQKYFLIKSSTLNQTHHVIHEKRILISSKPFFSSLNYFIKNFTLQQLYKIVNFKMILDFKALDWFSFPFYSFACLH